MKTAEEYLNKYGTIKIMDDDDYIINREVFIEAINEARKECIDECAEVAKVKHEIIMPHLSITEIPGGTQSATCRNVPELRYVVDKQSILKLKEQIK